MHIRLESFRFTGSFGSRFSRQFPKNCRVPFDHKSSKHSSKFHRKSSSIHFLNHTNGHFRNLDWRYLTYPNLLYVAFDHGHHDFFLNQSQIRWIANSLAPLGADQIRAVFPAGARHPATRDRQQESHYQKTWGFNPT